MTDIEFLNKDKYNFFSECKGSLILHHYKRIDPIHIDAAKLRDNGRGKRSVNKIGMTDAQLNGACCWEVRQRKFGGEFRHLKIVKTLGHHHLPWGIRYVRLVNC